MFPLSADPIDGFFALFGEGSVILDKKSLPLGASTVEVLNLNDHGDLSALDNAVRKLEPELHMLLSGPDAMSAALAHAALDEFWSILRRYPVYRHLEHQSETLSYSVRANPALLEAMLTPGTEDNASMKDWFHHLHDLSKSFRRFQNHAVALLERAFTDLPERSASAYARQINGYYLMLNLESQVMAEEIDELEGEEFRCTRAEILQEMDRRNFPESFQIRVSYRSVPHPKKEGKYLLAEQVMFQDVETFLSLDLLRGLAAGHLPRRCENCGKWFLLTSGFDTRYCENPAPDEPTKTCRQVGAHRKEKRLNGTLEIRKQYQRVCNRLKGQKHRGTLSADEWNQLMRQAQDLRDDANTGKIKLADLIARYDRISMRR